MHQINSVKTMTKKSDREYLNVVLEYVLSHAGDSQVNLASKAARDYIIKEINSMLDR